jgi:hypothetical protein
LRMLGCRRAEIVDHVDVANYTNRQHDYASRASLI